MERITSAGLAERLGNLLSELAYMDAQDRQQVGLVEDIASFEGAEVRSFADAGILYNDGLVIRLADGSEYQICVVRSR